MTPRGFAPARPVARRVLAALLGVLVAAGAHAGSLVPCAPTREHPAPVQDRLLQVTQVLRQELALSGARFAIVARSGQALERIGHRYSHAGIALRDNPRAPWAVRQLYFACDERRPRVFDQGLSGFVMGTHDPDRGHLLVLVPPEPAAALAEQAALDDDLALGLLGPAYSANAHAWSTRYQNCNQWVAELLALAWGPRAPTPLNPRERAQRHLAHLAYRPSTIQAHWPPIALGAAVLPWFTTQDHPAEHVAQGRFDVSMPASIAAWVHRVWPSTRQIALCHTASEVVVRHGGAPLAADCTAEAGDTVHPLTPHRP